MPPEVCFDTLFGTCLMQGKRGSRYHVTLNVLNGATLVTVTKYFCNRCLPSISGKYSVSVTRQI